MSRYQREPHLLYDMTWKEVAREVGRLALGMLVFVLLLIGLFSIPGCATMTPEDLSRYIDFAAHQPICQDTTKQCGCFVWDGAKYELHKCEPKPEPTPTPTPKPGTTDPKPGTTDPKPEEKPKPEASCPAKLPDDSALTINARCLYYTPSTGKCVTDSTGRVGDRGSDGGYCGVVTGNPAIHSCKAGPEGAPSELIRACDRQFFGSNCPLWFYSVDGGASWHRLLPDGIDAKGNPTDVRLPASMDHFDGWSESDGEYRGICEHANFGLKAPITGFGGVPHLDGLVRACTADERVCSQPVKVNY